MKTQSVFAFIPEFVEFELLDESVLVELVVASVPIIAEAVLDFYPQPFPFLDKWCEDVNNVNLNIFCPYLFRFTFPKLYVFTSIIQNESHYSHMYSPTLHVPTL